jgi:heterotetrameric sarcosine oxidase delta subunit
MLRIHCPYCGVRDHEEFSYFGDATKVYPPLDAEHHDGWVEAVYMRDNPKGVHAEFFK